MRRFPTKALMPLMALAMLFCSASTANAQLFGWTGYWGSYRPYYSSSYYSPGYSSYYSPSYYSAGYAPSYYSAGYAPSYYSASYAPSYYAADYTTSYVPTTTYYAPLVSSSSSCCSSGGCGLQASYAPSSSCCSPCTSCVSSCNSSCSSSLSPCGNCGTCSNCTMSSSQSPSSTPTPANQTFENQGTTTVQPRSNTGGTQPRTPTFIEEQDRSKGTNYENQNNPPNGGDPGFAPRNPSRDERSIDPLDQTFGTSSSENDGELRFKIPSSIINHRQPAPSHKPKAKPAPAGGNNENSEAEYPLLRLDEKITTRTLPTRTRLVRRQSWSQPMIARNVPQQTETLNLGWVPVPLPTQLVQK